MAHQERKFPSSIMYKTIDVGGCPVIVYVVDDLDNQQLADHFVAALNREDFEYCAALSAEAQSRGLDLIIL